MTRRWFLVAAAVVVVVAIAAVLVALGGGRGQPAPSTQALPTAEAAAPTEAPQPTAQAAAPTEAAPQPTVQAAAPTEAPQPTAQAAAPTEIPQPTAPPATPAEAAASSSSGGGTKVDLDKIFPPGEGRDLVLSSCTGCHSITPIVIGQRAEDEWARIAMDHRARVIAPTDEEYDTMFKYVAAHFNPDTPVPELPQELLDQWTSY